VIESTLIAVLPEMTRAASADFTVERMAVKAPTLSSETLIDDVAKAFAGDSSLRARVRQLNG
jgi:hypothetical protein